MITAKQVISETKRLINVPFCHFGRTTLGLDCSGLLWLAHHRCGMHLARIDNPYGPLWWRDPHQGERILNGFLNSWKFELCDTPVIGGIVLFRIYGKKVPINHCGLLINNDEFIHAKCGINYKVNKVIIESLQPGYAKRIAGYMIHKDIDYFDND